MSKEPNSKSSRPGHLLGPEWNCLEPLFQPAPITWRAERFHTEVLVAGIMVGWLTPRPHYCDRGHFAVETMLPYVDAADSFPRYYMSEAVAKSETEAWLKWRLWRQR